MLNPDIQKGFPVHPLRFTLLRFQKLGSTQDHLLDLLKLEEPPEGTVVIAEEQTHGRGQEGNIWESEAGKNLTFSLLLRPHFLRAEHQFSLNRMISLAMIRFLRKTAGGELPFSIKWPNDLYIGNKKAGGILIQHAVQGPYLEYSVIGIGINLNQTDLKAAGPNPTSLALETGNYYSPDDTLEQTMESVSEHYSILQSDPARLEQPYLDLLYQRGSRKKYLIRDEKVEGMISGVDEYGRLLVMTGSGMLCCDVKEIVYL